MTNILIDTLPTAVLVGGQEVPINTDFRDCLRVILAFEDYELTATERTMILLDNLFAEPPPDIQQAVQQAVKFLNGGESSEDDSGGPGLRLYGFAHDARLIFAAFRQTHGIDLSTVEGLHWWVFLALFMDLGAETSFCQLVGLRKRIKTGKASKEDRALYMQIRDIADLPEPDTRTPEERQAEAEFLRTIRAAERKGDGKERAEITG